MLGKVIMLVNDFDACFNIQKRWVFFGVLPSFS